MDHISEHHKEGPRVTRKLLKEEAKRLGFTVQWKYDECRLCPRGGSEDQAYYATDNEDCLLTTRNWR